MSTQPELPALPAPICPKCGAEMKVKHGYKGDFWGCTKYPKCNLTIDVRATREVAEARAKNPASKIIIQPGPAPVVKVATKSAFSPSKYQTAIFDAVERNDANYSVDAVAGSGKTTTQVESLKRTNKLEKVLMCAFNVHIKDAIAAKAPHHVKVSTIHSLGLNALTKSLKLNKDSIDDSKLYNIAKDVLPMPEDKLLRAPLVRLASMAKNTLVKYDDPEAVQNMADYYDIEMNGDGPRLIEALPIVMDRCKQQTATIDYDDMIWLPLVLGAAPDTYDRIFVDETQDLNAAQIQLVLKALRPTGTALVVGDPYQSIYGFRGADVNAMQRVQETLQAKSLPLSICYRCPTSHIELAQTIVPHIEAAPGAIEGVINDMSYNSAMTRFADGDLILCRINAPLISAAYALIRNNVKVTIRGRDIGKGLLSFVDKMQPDSIADLCKKVADYKWAEAIKYEGQPGKESVLQSLFDKCETMLALTDGMSSIAALKDRITALFDDNRKGGVVMSSIHRAKGDEAEHVWILKPELMPHPMASQPWQIKQEQNLMYVAYTRSKHTLTFVDGA